MQKISLNTDQLRPDAMPGRLCIMETFSDGSPTTIALVGLRKIGLYNPFARPQGMFHRLLASESSGSLITLISCDFATNPSLI